MSTVLKAYEDDALAQQWDDGTRVHTDFRTEPPTNRPYTSEENAEADARAAAEVLTANRAALSDPAQLLARLARLAAYDSDPDIVAALARSNSTAPTTQELNRLLKVMLRRESRISATLALAIRLLDPSLQGTISDTADA